MKECFLHVSDPFLGNERSAMTGNHGKNVRQARNKIMQVRHFRHDSDMVEWCSNQVPKVPQMGHLQGVVKLHASAKAVCALPEGGGSFCLLFQTLKSCRGQRGVPASARVGSRRITKSMTERCFLHDFDSEKYLWTRTVNVLQTIQF